MGSTEHEHFFFRVQRLGGHVHVHVWAGSRLQADNQARPKLGMLIMDPEQWAALRDLIVNGPRYALVEVDETAPDEVRPMSWAKVLDNAGMTLCTCHLGTGLGCPRHDPRYGEPEPETGPVEGRRFGPAFPEGAA
jgi:hypothetical protein